VTHRENCLRGESLSAFNVQKTHCPQGHPYDETNTAYAKRGGRYCKTCRRDLDARRCKARRERWEEIQGNA
jgi:hypothetical protein